MKTSLAISAPLLLLLSAASPAASYRNYTVDFNSLDKADTSSTAVWNSVRRELHLNYAADRTRDSSDGAAAALGNEDDFVSIGNGSDGVFDSTTYTRWDVNGGVDPSVVTLDTSRTYQFTHFNLSTGMTVRALGTAPLVIRVLGEARVDGTIYLRGSNGGAASAVAAGSAGTGSPGGGGNGGAGANLNTNGNRGTGGDGVLHPGGGYGGATDATAPGGGGGGAYDLNAGVGAGQNLGASGGAGGAAIGTDYIVPLYGGSGGGSGGSSNTQFGAGGGGGGGAVAFYVGGDFVVSATGIIDARGGNGGAASTNAGGGGGGSGGAILVYAVGALNNLGSLTALKGTGGAANGGSGASGGDGSHGRTRLVTSSGNGVDSGSSPQPNMHTLKFGQLFFDAQTTQSVFSKVFDAGNTAPGYVRVDKTATLPAGTTADVFVAGSSDNFQADNTGFVAESNLAALQGKRYFKFRVDLTTNDRRVSPQVQALTFVLNDHYQDQFRFQLGGCLRVPPTSVGRPFGLGAWILALAWLAVRFRYRRASGPN